MWIEHQLMLFVVQRIKNQKKTKINSWIIKKLKKKKINVILVIWVNKVKEKNKKKMMKKLIKVYN